MTTTQSSGCFILDTSVLLSEILKENTARVDKLKSDAAFYRVPCYMSNSVKQECSDKVQKTTNFLGTTVRDVIKIELENARNKNGIPLTSPMTSSDVLVLEELFLAFNYAARATKMALPSPLADVEEWAITYLGEQLQKGAAIDVPTFMTELVKKLLKVTSLVINQYDELVTFQKGFASTLNLALNPATVNSMLQLGLHDPDATHIAYAADNKTKNNQRTVFVTLDYDSISKKHVLKKLHGIACCDPLYAIHEL